MFAYYGAKHRIAHLYPAPQFPLIIEPFAGSAAYATLHHEKDIWVNELNPKIYRLWVWLQQAKESDILMLPRLARGQRVSSNSELSQEARLLLSLYANKGSGGTGNHDVVTMYGAGRVKTFRLDLARDLHKIRHWKITNFDYKKIENVEATWFIDPPYANAAGARYEFARIDYAHLSTWAQERKGQIIVCESAGATWLPFRRFHWNRGAAKSSMEMIWTNEGA